MFCGSDGTTPAKFVYVNVKVHKIMKYFYSFYGKSGEISKLYADAREWRLWVWSTIHPWNQGDRTLTRDDETTRTVETLDHGATCNPLMTCYEEFQFSICTIKPMMAHFLLAPSKVQPVMWFVQAMHAAVTKFFPVIWPWQKDRQLDGTPICWQHGRWSLPSGTNMCMSENTTELSENII